jgi:hypothetical protein
VPSSRSSAVPFALDLVAFLASGLTKADRIAGIFDLEAGLQGAEGDFRRLER